MNRNSDNNRSQDNNKKDDRDLPGYPHYPSNEDITNPENGFNKTSGDVEDLANSTRLSGMTAGRSDNSNLNEGRTDDDEEIKIVSGTEADVTSEDLLLLGERDADQDLGEDESTTNARVDDRDLEGDKLDEDELDIPGSEDDDLDEELGEEDEENNYYSLGGDNKEANEDDQA